LGIGDTVTAPSSSAADSSRRAFWHAGAGAGEVLGAFVGVEGVVVVVVVLGAAVALVAEAETEAEAEAVCAEPWLAPFGAVVPAVATAVAAGVAIAARIAIALAAEGTLTAVILTDPVLGSVAPRPRARAR